MSRPGDTEWIAAKKALSLAHSELNQAVVTLPYERLTEPLLSLRKQYDEANEYVKKLQRERGQP